MIAVRRSTNSDGDRWSSVGRLRLFAALRCEAPQRVLRANGAFQRNSLQHGKSLGGEQHQPSHDDEGEGQDGQPGWENAVASPAQTQAVRTLPSAA